MPEPAPPSRKRRSIPSFSEGVSSPKGQASEDGKIRALCMIRGACAAKAAPSWQDLRAVYSQTAVCGAFRMHGAHILPKPAHFGYTATICCHKLAIFPSEATFGMHGVKNLPRIAARERISQAFCHRQAPGERIFATSCQQSGIFVRAGLSPCHSSRTACIRRPLRAGRLAPPPRIDHNIDVRRGTNPQAKRTSSACARLIWGTDTGTGSQATVSTDPQQDRKVGSLAEIRQSSSHGRVTHRDLRGQLAS